jgi:hypothetical protein
MDVRGRDHSLLRRKDLRIDKGGWHDSAFASVLTGMTDIDGKIYHKQREELRREASEVDVKRMALANEYIEWAESGEPMDEKSAYMIQKLSKELSALGKPVTAKTLAGMAKNAVSRHEITLMMRERIQSSRAAVVQSEAKRKEETR